MPSGDTAIVIGPGPPPPGMVMTRSTFRRAVSMSTSLSGFAPARRKSLAAATAGRAVSAAARTTERSGAVTVARYFFGKTEPSTRQSRCAESAPLFQSGYVLSVSGTWAGHQHGSEQP